MKKHEYAFDVYLENGQCINFKCKSEDSLFLEGLSKMIKKFYQECEGVIEITD
jgi:hypothetical protein